MAAGDTAELPELPQGGDTANRTAPDGDGLGESTAPGAKRGSKGSEVAHA